MADETKKKRVRKPVTVDSLKEAVDQWTKAVGSHSLELAKLREKLVAVSEGEQKAKLEARLAAEEAKLAKSQKLAQSAQNRLTALKQHTENQDRKARTHRLIQLGALVEKAGLGDWESDRLLKALQGLQGLKKSESSGVTSAAASFSFGKPPVGTGGKA